MARVETKRPAVTGKTLADIARDKQALEEWLVENEGELTPELEALLTDHETERAAKIERIGYIISEEEAQIEAIKVQLARLTDRKRAAEGRIAWLKDGYLARLMQEMGMEPGDKVKGALSTVALQLNNPRLDGEFTEAEVFDLYEYDATLVKFVPQQYVPDKVAILAAAKLDPSILPEGVKVVRDISVRVK